MFISSEERRHRLKLWNVSEVARLLKFDIGRLHRLIKSDQVPAPSFQLGKTRYYVEAELETLKKALDRMD
jgi:hypothetical protein